MSKLPPLSLNLLPDLILSKPLRLRVTKPVGATEILNFQTIY